MKNATKPCPLSQRVDRPGEHSWRFDGDDPYVICVYCDEMRDAITDKVIRPRNGTIPAEAEPTNVQNLHNAKPANDLEQEARKIVEKHRFWVQDEWPVGAKPLTDDEAIAQIVELIRKGQREVGANLPHSIGKDNTLEIFSWKTPIGRKWNASYMDDRRRPHYLVTGNNIAEVLEKLAVALHPTDSQEAA